MTGSTGYDGEMTDLLDSEPENVRCVKCGADCGWSGIDDAQSLCEPCFDKASAEFDARVWCQNGHGPRHLRKDCPMNRGQA